MQQIRGCEAVQPRHVDVEQDQVESAIGHALQRAMSGVGQRRLRTKLLKQRFGDGSIEWIVIDQQHAQTGDLRLIGQHRRHAQRQPAAEGAAFTGCTVERKRAAHQLH